MTFVHIISFLMPTALLICMENTLWSIGGGGDFVELFKKSFTLYVESGMRKKTEAEIDMLRNVQGWETMDFDARSQFFKFIIECYLCKIHCFYLHLTHLTTPFTYIQPTSV